MEYKDITLKTLIANRPDLVNAVKNGEDEGTSTITVTKDLKGRRKVWTEITKDMDGVQVSKRVDAYTYYDTGELNTINQKVYGAGITVIKQQNITHYKNNVQPVVSMVAITVKIPLIKEI